MAQYEPEELGFPDKTSKDRHVPWQRYGQLKLGVRAVKKGVSSVVTV
jgi:hypothetical protein